MRSLRKNYKAQATPDKEAECSYSAERLRDASAEIMGVKEYRLFALQVSISLLAFAQNPNNYNAKGWKAASRFVSEYMDRRASPCVDIDRFMCGQFGDASDSEAYQVFYDEKTRKVFESFRTALESKSSYSFRRHSAK